MPLRVKIHIRERKRETAREQGARHTRSDRAGISNCMFYIIFGAHVPSTKYKFKIDQLLRLLRTFCTFPRRRRRLCAQERDPFEKVGLAGWLAGPFPARLVSSLRSVLARVFNREHMFVFIRSFIMIITIIAELASCAAIITSTWPEPRSIHQSPGATCAANRIHVRLEDDQDDMKIK